ncbi:ribbon-helix-helix domain-containing protein [Agrobacterium tumefaciens]|uniref:CopG family transcriptional regulator n=1 Tax=Agrobacterium tumefaciens TaxID=358 RepID=A0AA44F5V9_AGRTU|nr:CopG family transcriptional regulator [Agrobacterium tumefaciens]NTC19170.1 CopG family transcriptional regulator [Agrobacterium tumefaciens]NTC29392.1 CopG family transcriptional regulator [Agrobacterium tumefaciens]
MARPKTDKQGSRLTVTLDADDYAEVCARANANDVSAAWIIRRALQEYLGKSRDIRMDHRTPPSRLRQPGQ